MLLDKTMKMSTLVKITEDRVKDITMDELSKILPQATELESRMLKKIIKNDKGAKTEFVHEELGAILMIVIYRLMQDEVQNNEPR